MRTYTRSQMDTRDDHPTMEEIPAALYDAVSRSVGPWLHRRISALAADRMTPAEIDAMIGGTSAVALRDLRALLETDVDDQRANPLHVLRTATTTATEALRTAGVPPVPRDAVETEAMPDDVYALGPFTWRDLSDEVHDAGITWGAWKAATVFSRRREEGRR